MALTIATLPTVWPYASHITLGAAGVVTLVTLPLCDQPMRVTLRPRTTDAKIVGANATLADGDSIGSSGYRTMDREQEYRIYIPAARGNDVAPKFALASATASQVVEIDLELVPTALVRT